MIYPTHTSLPVIEVISKTPRKRDVTVFNRTVLYDYKLIDIYTNIKLDNSHRNGSEYVCTHSYRNLHPHKLPDFNNRKSGWLCTAFNIDLEDIKSKDFYILTDPALKYNTNFHASWILDTPNKITNNSQNFTSNPILINSIISELSENRNREIFVLHISINGNIKQTFNTYIVGVPRGTSARDIRLDNINPQPAFLIMKLWIYKYLRTYGLCLKKFIGSQVNFAVKTTTSSKKNLSLAVIDTSKPFSINLPILSSTLDNED